METKSKILIVDDEPLARDVLEGFLYPEGYHLDFASNGIETLAYLESRIPDVILLDVMMPEMDGFTACRRIKTDDRWRHIPIIMVTALGGKEDLFQGIEAGADDFVHKPVSDLELRARVRSMLRIKKQYDELEAAVQMREELTNMIVHDMRTPLSAILGFSGLLQTKNSLNAEDLEDVNKIFVQAQRLASFLDNMLMVAKTETTGRLTINPITIDINRLITQAQENHHPTARLKKIHIVTNLPAPTTEIQLDASLIQRVLDNLVSNALKFSPPQTTVTITVEYPNPGPKIRIAVADEGPGIAPEHRKRIFDKFEVINSNQYSNPQIGVGLAFCKMAVEAHGGRIFIDDNPAGGSIFVVEI